MNLGRTKAPDRGSLADFGLVGLVVGGTATLVLGMVTLGIGALLGSIPLVLGILLGLAALVTILGLLLTVATARGGPPARSPAPEHHDDS